MRHMRRWVLAGAAVLAGVVAATWAQSITTVDPGDATIGTQITITGQGFGDAKPKVSIVPRLNGKTGPRPFKLGVVTLSDTQIVAAVKKAAEGTYSVVVQPKGGEPITAPLPFHIVLPVLDGVEPATPERNTDVTLTGTFFGTKKPKVTIGGKKAKVLEFSDTSITARVHKKTPLGSQTVVVTNRIGPNTVPVAVDVQEEAGGEGGGDGRVDLRAGGRVARGIGDDVQATREGTGFRLVADAQVIGGGAATLIVDLSNIDLSMVDSKDTVQAAMVEYSTGGTTWRAMGTVDVGVRRNAGGTFDAELDGSLARVSGSGEPDPLPLQGRIIASIP